MPFPQVKEINYTVKFICILFTVFVVAGCAGQGAQSVKTGEQEQAESKTTMEQKAEDVQRQINNLGISSSIDEKIEIKIEGNQRLVYTSIKQSFPFGIAVYLPETKIGSDLVVPDVSHRGISDLIITYADKEETTAKIEILLTQDLNYEVMENDNALTVSLSGVFDAAQTIAAQEVKSPPAKASQEINATAAASKIVVAPEKTATLTNIEFNTMEDGKSDIVIQTNLPVKYDIIKGENGTLNLNLYNTIIPYYHKRALLTHYFKSAVESLMPIQVPGKNKTAKIEISTRDTVPYRVVQDHNTLSLFFEPSRVEPPVFTKSKKKVVSGEQTQIASASMNKMEETVDSNVSEKASGNKKTTKEMIFGISPKYTGEKIKLDFYETDIKNVIRILRSVGGMNFAIDKDVAGKVTLSLEDPVPWDQVLDLVLKMNDLGQKREGNVIRIATMATLKKEDQTAQDAIAAHKKSLAQKESFEPLVTEYIPINYSDADTDIRPHIEKILTSDRGKASVDKRTNMLIITDVQAKIDQAHEIIFRLDRVTPQIMIEAKVVEVTKDFSRELGLGLNFTQSQTEYTENRDHDFSVALNSPLSSASNSGSFNFYRILGSNFLSLNAQIAASETKGDVKIVSSPRILTLDNKKARIKQGLEYAYLERDDTGGSSVAYKNIDLLLEVTPHVTPDNRISMMVYLTKNDVDSISADGVPTLSTNEAETELLVNDKDTVIIGGIVKSIDNDSTTGTPILSGIPVLGRLFRTDINTDKRTELLIFLTPSIVKLEQKRNTFTSTTN